MLKRSEPPSPTRTADNVVVVVDSVAAAADSAAAPVADSEAVVECRNGAVEIQAEAEIAEAVAFIKGAETPRTLAAEEGFTRLRSADLVSRQARVDNSRISIAHRHLHVRTWEPGGE